jgi:hypothetical protein
LGYSLFLPCGCRSKVEGGKLLTLLSKKGRLSITRFVRRDGGATMYLADWTPARRKLADET